MSDPDEAPQPPAEAPDGRTPKPGVPARYGDGVNDPLPGEAPPRTMREAARRRRRATMLTPARLQQGQYQAADILAELLSGILVGGLLGWFIDSRLERTLFLPIGLISGACLGLYVVLIRYGRS